MSKTQTKEWDETPASVGLPYEDIRFHSRFDGVKLKGWYIPGNKEYSMMIINGGTQDRVDSRTGTLEITRGLVENGYNVFLFDQRGRGESDGKSLQLAVRSTSSYGLKL